MKYSVLYILLLLVFTTSMYSQNDSIQVKVLLRILDDVNGMPVFNAKSISYKTMLSFATDEDGILNYNFDADDSIKVFAMGYEAQTLKVDDFIGIDSMVNIRLNRQSYMLRSVDVHTKKLHLRLPEDIKLGKPDDADQVSLRNDGFSGKPPVLAAVASPASFIHYYASKKEKRKREFRKELVKHAEQEKINAFYNVDIIKEVSAYEGDTLTRFIVYCNTKLTISSNTNPLLVQQMIFDAKTDFEEARDETEK